MELTDQERLWVWLSSVDGIGVKRFYQLLTAFRDPQAVWDNVGAPEMRFLGSKVLSNLRSARSAEYLDRLFESIEKSGCDCVCRISDRYPPLLTQIYDPPPTLYVLGDCDLSAERMFSIVGSRRCTRDGQRAAREIAAGLAREDVVVVSGLARGIDTCAHEGALSVHGRTVAVFGAGPDVIYPPENAELADRILADGGALISEYPPGTPPNAGHFPQRNRIIAGLTPGTLLVEGAKGSGAMITVNLAADAGRDIFAVPGSIYSVTSSMPNHLLVQGATPALGPWEILEAYRWAQRPGEDPKPFQKIELDETEKSIVEAIANEALTFEELRGATGLASDRLSTHLTMLELRGVVVRAPGNLYRAYLNL